MNQHGLLLRPGCTWKPCKFLEHAERIAVEIRKMLAQLGTRKGVSSVSASTDDAEALADLIEQLARFGRKSSAADAIEIAERVEVLIDMLRAEIDVLLAS